MKRYIEPLRRRNLLLPLAAGIATLLLAGGFLALGSEVTEGETRGIDLLLLDWAVAERAASPKLVEVMRDLSGLGSGTVLTLFAVATVVYIAAFSSPARAALIGVAVGSGSIVVPVLKSAFGRLRPDLSQAAFEAAGLSFPSGHASMSAVVFLTMAALVAETRPRWRERVYIVAVAAAMAALVGISRVVLGVHYGTDVVGGWAFGIAWASGWWLVVHAFDRRSAMLRQRR